jgi:EAL domain-containing protein (putative c-di-GMP-specific phosphodiesterase class I)/GGDEF domain-containing protein
MNNQQFAPDSLLSEAEFLKALRQVQSPVDIGNGGLAVLLIRVDAYMSVAGLVGKRNPEDLLLLRVGDRLRSCLRTSDLLARSKSGTFLIGLGNLQNEDQLELICERIIRAGKKPFEIAGREIHTGFMVGAAMISDELTDSDSLLREATAAMCRQLRDGVDGFSVSTHKSPVGDSNHLEIKSMVQNALRDELFELEFQPQYQRDGTLCGTEALVRMQIPGGERLEGANFLPQIEGSELFTKTSEQVFRQVCFQIQEWLRRGVPVQSVTLSVAAPFFLGKDFPDMVGALLRESTVPGHFLELELSEATIMIDFANSAQALTRLTKLGIRFVLSGFGLGPFPSSYLQRLPIRTIQINCSSSVRGYANLVSAAIISRGHRLGLRAVAKNIQSDAQRKALLAAGCDAFQGPLLSLPLSKEEMELVLLSSASTATNAS